jgi:hypothetical protein
MPTATRSSAIWPRKPLSMSVPVNRSSPLTPRRTNSSDSSRTVVVEYQPGGEPEQVNVHDFPDKELGKAIPYGIYDVSVNSGWVSVGGDHDTSAFAVATLRTWWDTVGTSRYQTADRLLGHHPAAYANCPWGQGQSA